MIAAGGEDDLRDIAMGYQVGDTVRVAVLEVGFLGSEVLLLYDLYVCHFASMYVPLPFARAF